MKIGIFPGSFDPLHQSHLKIIDLSFLQLKLDRLFLIPIVNPRKNQTPIKSRVESLKKFFSGNEKISVLFYNKLNYWHFIDNFISKHPKHNYYRLMGETCYNSYPEVGKPPLRDEPDTLTDILQKQTVVIMPNPIIPHRIIKAKTLDRDQTKKIIVLNIKNEKNYTPVSSVTQKIKKDPILGLKELKYNKYYKSLKSLNFAAWEKNYWQKTTLRIGVSHGTFDNLHEGHLQLFELAKKQLKLDCVLVWPSFCPHHKPNSKSFEERYRLLEGKLAFYPHYHILPVIKNFVAKKNKELEARNVGEDIIQNIFKFHEMIVDWLISQLPPTTKYFRLFGADSILEYLNKYGNDPCEKNPLNVMLGKGNLAVLERDGFLLPKILPRGIIKLYTQENLFIISDYLTPRSTTQKRNSGPLKYNTRNQNMCPKSKQPKR